MADRRITQYRGYHLHTLVGVISGIPYVYNNKLDNHLRIIGSVDVSSFLSEKLMR